MNKITRLTIAALCGSMMLSVSGCNSLDQMPTNKFTDDSFWSSADRAQSVLNMAYNQMYSHDKIWQDESLSDNMYELKGSPDSHTIRAGLANASLGLFESEWKWLYQGIKTTNVFMDKIDLVPDMDADAKAGMIAQIRFIRAYLYFRAVNFYGAVPFFRRVFFEEERRAGVLPREGLAVRAGIKLGMKRGVKGQKKGQIHSALSLFIYHI